MARAPESTAGAEQVVFEPDELTFADNRVTVTGRWFGVRGRRFVRPTLTLGREGAGSRVHADLEQKPWAAEDGEPWTAEFVVPRSSGGAEEVELAVAPDIAVVLRAPDAIRARPKRRPQSRRRASAPRAGEGNGRGTTTMTASQAKVEVQQAEIARLEQQLRRSEITRAEFNAAVSRRDAAVAKLDTVLKERDAAVAERDAAAADRDAAVEAREAALDERDAIRDEHRRVTRDRDSLEQERDGLGRRRRELERAVAELESERDELRTRLADAIAAPQGTPIEPAQPVPPPPLPVARPTPAPASARAASRLRASDIPLASVSTAAVREPRSARMIWVTRGIALAVLLAAIVALLLILQSV